MKEKRRMISEAAKELGLETYTLRAWEEELKLNIPRNDKGYRYYGEKELHTFMKIRDMRDEGMNMDEIKEALPKNVIPFPAGGSSVGPQDKMEQFQNVMVKIMGRALNTEKSAEPGNRRSGYQTGGKGNGLSVPSEGGIGRKEIPEAGRADPSAAAEQRRDCSYKRERILF